MSATNTCPCVNQKDEVSSKRGSGVWGNERYHHLSATVGCSDSKKVRAERYSSKGHLSVRKHAVQRVKAVVEGAGLGELMQALIGHYAHQAKRLVHSLKYAELAGLLVHFFPLLHLHFAPAFATTAKHVINQ